ncbi:MAG: 5'-nucleotidase [Gammaproteobacteria bacterium]|nr:5'-nucleotidase [Gammaproteobacteria bacterium]MDE0365923.1 5'-nucleotidase [Gammaproteobacteria bacterium]
MSRKPLTVAISSRALFDLHESNRIFEAEGLEAYRRFQIEHEDRALKPGDGFVFVEKLLNINKLLDKHRVEVILLSRNTADTGLRIFNSIAAHGLNITRAAFCGGESPYRYIRAFGCDLFLSTHATDVGHALEHGVAAATLLPAPGRSAGAESGQLRLAFDGDAVLFSDTSERVFQEQGLEAFSAAEAAAAEPLEGGPFKSFLGALHSLQQEFDQDCPIRTALITARGAPAHERVIRTLRAWNIRLDESLFLGGMKKTAFLKAFGADVFFDDQTQHCESAATEVTAGHVPHGVRNENRKKSA